MYLFTVGLEEPIKLSQTELDIFLDASLPLPGNIEELRADYEHLIADAPSEETISLWAEHDGPIMYKGSEIDEKELAVYLSLALKSILANALADSKSAEGDES